MDAAPETKKHAQKVVLLSHPRRMTARPRPPRCSLAFHPLMEGGSSYLQALIGGIAM